MARLQARLDRPERAADDWSITPPRGCDCELCAKLAAFLRDPTQRTLTWPLVTAGRRHLHHRIDLAELPVTHQTIRRGRPYSLVLTKTGALFSDEARDRTTAERQLNLLVTHWA